MDRSSVHSSQNYAAMPCSIISPLKKVQVVYYLSYRGGLLEQPHLMEISLSSSQGVRLRDVKTRLLNLRGVTSSSFSWSYKRSYKEGFVWQDLESDDDLIFPTHNGSEYVVKGCRIESSCTSMDQIPPSQNIPRDWSGEVLSVSTQMQPASRLAELPTPPTLTQLNNAVNRLATDNHASPSNASSCRGDDNIPFNLGVIEGLEHLHLAKAIDLNYDCLESQASDRNSHITRAQLHKKNVENLILSKEPDYSKLHMKRPITERETYDSTEFSVIKNVKTSPNPSPYVAADATTQTGEDDEIINTLEEHGEGKLSCLSGLYHRDNLACHDSRDASLRNFIELSRKEISPPPCSSSSSSTTTSAHSAASSSVVSSSVNQLQNLSLDKSSCLAADQNLQELQVLLSSKICSDKDAVLNKEEAMATKSPVDCDSQRRETSSFSAEINKNLSSDALDDHIQKNPTSALNSSKVKPHMMMNICSGSGRFLHLVSCGRGLEVIKPINARRIKQIPSNKSYINCSNCEEYSCLDLSSLNVNAESESTATNLDSCLPIAANRVPREVLRNGGNHRLVFSPRDRNSGSKKLWHIRGWVQSSHKKKRDPRSKIISTGFAAGEDAYTCLDLFEKHVARSSIDNGTNEDCSSSRRRLIRMGSADYSSSSQQR